MKPIATDNYDFERLVTGGYAYVDKTDMLWKLANGKNGTLFFISRPRRFGKSLMLSTFKYLFQGKRKLFKGLKIEKKKWDWSKEESNMPETLGDCPATLDDLELFDTDYLQWKALLVQDGCLTIKKVMWTDDEYGRRVSEVVLGVPNCEMRDALDSVM